VTETYTLWARKAQQLYEQPTTDRSDCTPDMRDGSFQYLRMRAAWHATHRGAVAFSIRDLSGMHVYESWVVDNHGSVVPRQRPSAPEALCRLLLQRLSPAQALEAIAPEARALPYWAKVVELLETFSVRPAQE
jgi:hypothetical protein